MQVGTWLELYLIVIVMTVTISMQIRIRFVVQRSFLPLKETVTTDHLIIVLNGLPAIVLVFFDKTIFD